MNILGNPWVQLVGPGPRHDNTHTREGWVRVLSGPGPGWYGCHQVWVQVRVQGKTIYYKNFYYLPFIVVYNTFTYFMYLPVNSE